MRLEEASLRLGGGDSSEYTSIIYCSRMVMVPTEYHRSTGRSLNVSLFRLSKLRASSRFAGSLRFFINPLIIFS